MVQTLACGIAAIALTAWAQPQFEVAAIRKSAGMETLAQQTAQGSLHIGIKIDGGRVEIGMLSIYDMVAIAYRMKPDQIVRPGWMREDHWDISAKIPEGESSASVPEMLASLLRERFKLKMHRETHPLNVYALTVDPAGPKLPRAEATTESASAGRGIAITGPSGAVRVTAPTDPNGTPKVQALSMTMDGLAEFIRPLLDRPVVNETGLTAAYQVTLNLAENDSKALMRQAMGFPLINDQSGPLGADPQAVALVRSLQKLGLQLKGRKIPVEVIVVDSFQKEVEN